MGKANTLTRFAARVWWFRHVVAISKFASITFLLFLSIISLSFIPKMQTSDKLQCLGWLATLYKFDFPLNYNFKRWRCTTDSVCLTFALSMPKPTVSLAYMHSNRFATRVIATLPSCNHKDIVSVCYSAKNNKAIFLVHSLPFNSTQYCIIPPNDL